MFPPWIDAPIFEAGVKTISPPLQSLLTQVYVTDSYSAIPRYIYIEGHELDESSLATALEAFLQAFEGLPFDRRYPHLLIGKSVLEWELQHAVALCDQTEPSESSRASYYINANIVVIRKDLCPDSHEPSIQVSFTTFIVPIIKIVES